MLRGIPKEDVILRKRNGESFEIKAHVQSKTIFVDDATANIEEEDIFIRSLPNGNQEYYRVLDRGYCDGIGSIPAHYQVRLKR